MKDRIYHVTDGTEEADPLVYKPANPPIWKVHSWRHGNQQAKLPDASS